MMIAAKNSSTRKATPAPAIIESTLKNLDKVAGDKMHFVSSQTLTASIMEAVGFGKKALQLELATGLALFADQEGVTRESKQALQKIYVQAGYDAEDQFRTDYKTVRRRIDAAAELYEWFGSDSVASMIGSAKEKKAITNIMRQIEHYELRGINSVFALVGKPVNTRKAHSEVSAETLAKPAANAEDAQHADAAHSDAVAAAVAANIEQARRERNERRTDVPGAKTFGNEHVQITVMPEATRAEVLAMISELVAFASTLKIPENEKLAA